jgi:hypothetical protein
LQHLRRHEHGSLLTAILGDGPCLQRTLLNEDRKIPPPAFLEPRIPTLKGQAMEERPGVPPIEFELAQTVRNDQTSKELRALRVKVLQIQAHVKPVRRLTDERDSPLQPHPIVEPEELQPHVKGVEREVGHKQPGALFVDVDQDADSHLALLCRIPDGDGERDTREPAALDR